MATKVSRTIIIAQGGGEVRFKFNQMDSLLGGQHDIEFPVVGDNEGGLNVCRPEVLGAGREQEQQSRAWEVCPEKCAGTSRTGGTQTSNTRRLRRTRAPANQLVDVIQDSEQASQRRPDEILEEMRAQRISFENLMREYLSKRYVCLFCGCSDCLEGPQLLHTSSHKHSSFTHPFSPPPLSFSQKGYCSVTVFCSFNYICRALLKL